MNTTERDAVKVLLKRYDIISAWKLVFRPLLYVPLLSFFSSITLLFLVTSWLVFSSEKVIFSEIFGFNFETRIKILYFLSNNTLSCFLKLAVLFSIAFSVYFLFAYKNSLNESNFLSFIKSGFDDQRSRFNKLFNKENKKSIRHSILNGRNFLFCLVLILILSISNSVSYFGWGLSLTLFISLFLIRTRYFVLSVFLPRIIISITYIWATYVLTEENTRLFYGLEDQTYAFIIIVSLLGTFTFLFFEAQQYAPSTRWDQLILKRVMPVFSFTVSIAIIFGLLVNKNLGEARIKQSAAIASSFLSDSLSKLNKQKDEITILDTKIDQIRSQAFNLPNIPVETKLQSLTNSDKYSVRYNYSLSRLQERFMDVSNFINRLDFNSADSDSLKKSLIRKFDQMKFSKLTLAKKNNHQLRLQDQLFYDNQLKIDSLISELEEFSLYLSKSIYVADSIFHNPGNAYNEYSGYSFFAKKPIDTGLVAKLTSYYSPNTKYVSVIKGRTANSSLVEKETTGKAVLYTKFPLNLSLKKQVAVTNDTNLKPNEDLPFVINLKSFLLQVAIAIALGVIGQLIISDKTATEAL